MTHFEGRFSTVAIVAALIVAMLLGTGAVLFSTGDQALERVAVLFAFFATIIPALLAALRADQAATRSGQASEQTNGTLDTRIANAVAAALQARRATDHVIVADTRIDPATPVLPDPPA